MLICPLTSDECSKQIIPKPKSGFLIMSSVKEGKRYHRIINLTFKTGGFDVVLAADLVEGGNIYCKICREIQSNAFEIILHSEDTPSKSFPNLYLELGLSYTFGKEVIYIIEENVKPPSDLDGIECIRFSSDRELIVKLQKRIKRLSKISGHCFTMGDLAFRAGDYEKASEYLKKSVFLTKDRKALERINEMIDILGNKKDLDGQQKRLKDQLKNFIGLLYSHDETLKKEKRSKKKKEPKFKNKYLEAPW